MVSPCAALPLVLAILCLTCTAVSAWGGLFNRFHASVMSNLGYGNDLGQVTDTSLFQGPILPILNLEQQRQR
jgi:hypothetical protein